MQRFKQVLLYVGDDGIAAEMLHEVEDLARRNGARLLLMSTVEEPSRLRQFWPGDDVDDVLAQEVVDAEQRLVAMADALDVPTEWRVDRGVVAIEIIRRVLLHEADLVITVDTDAPPSPDVRRLLRKCPCPVWVMRPGLRSANGLTVVAAVNPSPDEADLNTLILELASSMVERAGGVMHVVHAWEMIGSATKAGRELSGRFNVTYDELTMQARARRADAIDHLLGGLRHCPIERRVHLVHGSAESVITQVVADEAAEVLVMGTVARTGISGLLVGNTAERVLTEASCSLMAVKPDGFVSPVDVAD